MSQSIPVAEVFGPTIQGEGDLAGHSTYFIRVGGCDFACRWCDSAHAVLAEQVRELPRFTQDEITKRLLDYRRHAPGAQWLTISGGNPALYDLTEVVVGWKLTDHGKVAVETQGSKWKGWLSEVDLLTISPKPPSSGMKNDWDFNTFMIQVDKALGHNGGPASSFCAVLKVVVFDEADYEFAKRVHRTYPDIPFYLSCGTASGGLSGEWTPPLYGDAIMAIHRGGVEDSKADLLERYRWLAEKTMTDRDMADVAVLPQLHTLLWGVTTRGV